MSQFDFDYELIFTNTFDQSVINSSNIPEKSVDFSNVISAEVGKIVHILELYQGVNTMSSFATFNSKNYKLTVNTA